MTTEMQVFPLDVEKESRCDMALSDFRKSVTGKAAAVGLGAAVAFLPLSDTFAQDAAQNKQPVVLASTATSEFQPVLLQDAHSAAGDWALTNPGIAVAVSLGTESRVTPQQIRDVLTREFSSSGVQNVEFFYRQNDVPGTGVSYYYLGHADGPFHLGEARPAAQEAAAQFLFEQKNPALSFNTTRTPD